MKLKGKVKFIPQEKSQFFSVLKQRVDNYFEENNISKHANASMVLKTIILLSGYSLPFIALLLLKPTFGIALLIWFLMGVCLAGIGMSVMHDANHGAYSENKYVNAAIGHTLNLLGGSVHNWKLQHNILHHTYTNITGMDEDIADRLVLKFSPHTKVKWFHKFQPFYAFIFYGLMTAYWVFLKDLIQLIQFTKTGVNAQSPKENLITFARISFLKIVYLFTMLVVPTLYFGIPFIQVFAGFMLMHYTAGIILSLVFQLAHSVEETSHPMPTDSGVVENDWAIHQLNTTLNFSPNNKLLSWYVGGLNFQVEHHLFPRICHVHYPNIAPIVKQTAEEFGIPYLQKQDFTSALKSHFSALERFGTPPANQVIA